MRPPDDVEHGTWGVGRRWLWIIFLLALTARAGWGLGRMIAADGADLIFLPDEQQYWLMAKSLVAGGGLRDELGFRAGRMPLYPVFLALFAGLSQGVWWARAAQWVIGALGAVLAARLGAEASSRRTGILAGGVVAVDPHLVYTSSLLLTETLFITALIGLWTAATAWLRASQEVRPHGTKRRPEGWLVFTCLSAAACIYLREAALGFVAALIFLMGFYQSRWRTIPPAISPPAARTARGLVTGACVAGVILLSLIPWGLRNRAVMGRWVWLTTRGGITLYDGVRPGADGRSDLGEIKAGPDVREYVERGDEAAWDDHFRQAAWACIRGDPWRVLRLVPVKLVRTWSLVPNLAEGRSLLFSAVSAGWTGGVYAFALIGVYHGLWGGGTRRLRRGARDQCTISDDEAGVELRSRWCAAALMAPALVVTLLHSVYVGSVRYRLPAVPFLEILAAIGMWHIVDTLVCGGGPKPENRVARTE